MPYTERSIHGTSFGNLTPDEEMRQRQAAQADALRAQLAIAQMSNDTQRHGIDSQREVAGTFGQRAGQDSAMFDKKAGLDRELDQAQTQRSFGTVDRQMAPSLMDAQLRSKQYQDSSGVENERRALQMQALKQAGGLLGGMAAPAATPGAAAGGTDKWDQLAALGALANGGQMPDFGSRDINRQTQMLTLQDAQRKAATTQATSARDAGDIAKARELASQGNVSIDIPTVDDYMRGEGAAAVQDIGDRAKTFGQRDRAWFTADPSSGDEEGLVTAINTLAAQISRKTGVPLPEAMQRAKQVITDAMSKDDVDFATDFGGDRTQQLLGRIGAK